MELKEESKHSFFDPIEPITKPLFRSVRSNSENVSGNNDSEYREMMSIITNLKNSLETAWKMNDTLKEEVKNLNENKNCGPERNMEIMKNRFKQKIKKLNQAKILIDKLNTERLKLEKKLAYFEKSTHNLIEVHESLKIIQEEMLK